MHVTGQWEILKGYIKPIRAHETELIQLGWVNNNIGLLRADQFPKDGYPLAGFRGQCINILLKTLLLLRRSVGPQNCR